MVAAARAGGRAGLLDSHSLREYRAAFGETPHQHFTRLRLEHARRALARGAAVTEVCFDVGYSSLGSFSALFARTTGPSPRASQRELRALVLADLPRLYIPGCFLGFFVDHGPLSGGSTRSEKHAVRSACYFLDMMEAS
jgi:AraC-like DNA-binding protein